MRKRHEALCATVLALGFAAGEGVAQRPVPDAGVSLLGGEVADEHGRVHRALTVAPWIAVESGRSSVDLVLRASLLPDGVLGGADLGAATVIPGPGPLGIGLAASGGAAASDAGYRAARLTLSPRLRADGRHWSATAGPTWSRAIHRAGADLPGSGGLLPDPRRAGSPRTLQRDVRGVEAGVRAGSRVFSVAAGLRSLGSAGSRWREWSGTAAMDLPALSLALRLESREGDLTGESVSGRMSVPLGTAAALVAEAGRALSDPLLGTAGGRFASLGLTLRTGTAPASGARGPRAPVPSGDGRVRLALRAAAGARVEILGDWTGWRPVPVPEVERGRYEIAVALPPGTHRFAFRVDGEWRIPAAAETEPDGYGGRHAVVRVGER